MEVKEALQKVVSENDIDYLGISSVQRFENVPEGHKPIDLLPSARSVIVLGLRIPSGAIRANDRAFEGLRHAIYSYVNFGYNKVNEHLDFSALAVVRYIERNYGFIAYAIPAGWPRDEYLMMGAMSNRYAAVCAGLGEFGWSGFVLTPQDGPRVRWISIITEMEIEPDPLYHGPKLCKGCKKCVDTCPVGALAREESVEVKIGEYRSAYSLRNKALCRSATRGLVRGTPGRLQADIPYSIKTMEEWYELNKKDDPWQRMEIARGNYCYRCMTVCPAGKGEHCE